MATRFEAVRGDITVQDVDAIVNAANSDLAHGGGVAAAIARAAGPELERASREHPRIETGEAGWTPAGNLQARWVIHTVGPIWHGGGEGEEELLASAYRSAVSIAAELGARSVAFPAISTGIYGYPPDLAAPVAAVALRDAAAAHPGVELIRMCLFSEADLRAFHSLGWRSAG